MNVGNWLELGFGLPTLIVGGVVIISRLTRIVVSVETTQRNVQDLGDELRKEAKRDRRWVQDHENRLNRAGL